MKWKRKDNKRRNSKPKRKKKGKNSLAQRCTCGNKLPCDGDVMITKNEFGKLEYHKIPRHWVGPAHSYEMRQPAQYMTTPSNANLSKLVSHLSPALLEEYADMMCIPAEDALKLGNATARNASLNPEVTPCVICNSTRHLYIDCPWTTTLSRSQVS